MVRFGLTLPILAVPRAPGEWSPHFRLFLFFFCASCSSSVLLRSPRPHISQTPCSPSLCVLLPTLGKRTDEPIAG